MKRKREDIRLFGQLSLPSSFLSGSRVIPGGAKASNEAEFKKPSKSSISLSEFLSRKLDKSNEKTVQERRCSFTSVTNRLSVRHQRIDEEETQSSLAVKGTVFQQFKGTAKDQYQTGRNGEGEVREIECPTDKVFARKGNNPFAVSTCSGQPVHSRYLVVLGDDPKAKQMRMGSSFTSKRADHIFNHYANGGGWWDSNMEGVDQEEVGCNEAWESMGATTLGGLEWH